MDEGSLRNDIVKAQEDEKGFDLLNDETFGDLGTYNDDWENEHEMFAEADTKYKARFHGSDHSPDFFEEDNFYEVSFQNDVENQLTRLVLDDDDNISTSTLTCNDNFARPYDMWADSLHLDFRGCSKNMTSNGCKGSSSFITSKDGPSTTCFNEHTKNGQIMNSKKAMTVEELERMLLTDGILPNNQNLQAQLPFASTSQPQVLPFGSSGHQIMSPNQHHLLKSIFCPQDFGSRMPTVPSSQSQRSFATPHHQQRFCFQSFGSHPFQPQFLPPQGILLPARPSSFHSARFCPPVAVPLQQGHQHFQQSQPMIFNQQASAMHRHHLARQRIALQRHGPSPDRLHRPKDRGHRFQQNVHGRCLPANEPQQFPLYLQQQFQQRQMVMMMARRNEGFPARFSYPARPYWECGVRPEWKHNSMPLSKEVEKLEMMEYDGLMEQREKDWIIKIQLMQLHTDSPYVDDYYFTCWSMKKLMKETLRKKRGLRKSQEIGVDQSVDNGLSVGEDEDNDCDDEAPALLVPQLAKTDVKRYAPVQYEGSLGKLTASSIHNPRQIIDVHLSSNTEDAKRHDSKKLKETFAKIEKAFDVLLVIDDIEKKALAQPVENRSKYYDERKDLVSRLCNGLLTEEACFLHQALTVRKGAAFVIRLLPLASEIGMADEIVCRILEKLASVLKREWSDEVSLNLFKSVSKIIINCSSTKSQFISAIYQNLKVDVGASQLSQIIHSELGLSLVLFLIDEVNDENGNVDEWSRFVQSVAGRLASADVEALPRPFKVKSGNQKTRLGRRVPEVLNSLGERLPKLSHIFAKANEVLIDLLNDL